MKNQETTCRKKLYKSGKLWVTAGVSLIIGLGMSVQQVSADTIHYATVKKIKDTSQDVPVAATKKISNIDQNVPVSSNQTKGATDNVQDDTLTQPVSNDLSAQTTVPVSNDKTTIQDSSNSVANQNKNTDSNANTVQAKDSLAVTAPVKTSTDVLSTTGPSTTNSNSQPNTDTTNNQVAVANNQKDNDVATKNDDSVPVKAPTEDQASKETPVKENNQSETKKDSNQYHSKNIQTIDGKTYYIDDNGQAKKNFTTVVDGQVLYFDKETGLLSATNDYQFKQGLTSQNNSFTAHNAVENTTKDNFTEIDGYLTADSWYRPKDILVNGKDWTPSSDKDFRPLLMSWWPDKITQVNYLNYMKSLGLSNSSVDFSANDDQSILNQASQDTQLKIEQKISQEGQTNWLQHDISDFVDSQSNWNVNSELQTTGNDKDHLQGGALRYVNSDKTPNANSDYRLLNRTPTNQKGYSSYSIDPTQGGYDFLLANDVDNSNPVVQAEQLNWMYYLLNFGSITNQDADANFDGIRVDAVDNVDADLLEIASDYMKAAYGVDKNDTTANQHLSILEDWSDNDAAYVKDQGNNQLSMDNKLRLALKYSLTMPLTDQKGTAIRSGLEPLITNSLVDRTTDSTDNIAQPNYSFVRAHDSEVQTVIAEIIKEKIDANSDGLTPTIDQLEQAFKIYNADQLKTNKEFTQFNMPSAYALLLTNKDTVPRVYYGDLYTDDGQYMANKSPYYDAINTLLQSRLKYVSGGQKMSMAYMMGDSSMAAQGNRGLLTSVRYGKGAMTADDKGTTETRAQGIAVIEGNNPELKLSTTDQIILKMGAAHKNQAYRPAILTTKNGIVTYLTDAEVDPSLVKYTTGNGELVFNQSDIQGVANPQVSGYLAVWVPVGASNIQDARTSSDNIKSVNDNKTLHSNAALDSQVIYEGFSNFQYFPTTESEYANVVIAKNTDLYKSWGITSFELPPQYRSSTEGSFLDSIIQNGYAFTDRYDLGFNTPTKYGTVDQLRDAIKALHATGIKAMADWVPDQIYNLTGKQIVTAERVNNSGVYNENSVINKTLYAAETVGGGDYQKLYGGAFLETIKSLYPSLFTTNQISTGVPMDPSEKIQEWSAKYFNGSNIQGRGAYYVLKDWATNSYFQVSSADKNNDFLPKQLMNQISNTGFASDDKGMTYFSTSGYQAKDTFIQDEKSNWYYFDKSGYMIYGLQTINNDNYYFLPNGIELQDAYLSDSKGNVYYFNKQGKQTVNNYFIDSNKNWRYFDQNGVMARGLSTIKEHVQYFNQDGTQVKDQFITDADGKLRYFTLDSGDMLTNQFKKLADGSWAYFGVNGLAVKGQQTINGQNLYFDDNYHQVKGHEQVDNQGIRHFYDADSGEMISNRFEKLTDGSWAYFDGTGQAVKGYQTIKGQKLYFDDDANQIKGHEIVNQQGQIQFYDADSGEMISNRFEKLADGSWAYFDATGQAVKGYQTINGQKLYFDDNYHQVKGQAVTDNHGIVRYYDANSGAMVTDHFEKLSDNSWRYFGNDGTAKVSQPTV